MSVFPPTTALLRRGHHRTLPAWGVLAAALVVAISTPAAATATGKARVAIHTAGFPTSVTSAFGSMWVTSHRGGYLYRINPSTNKLITTVDVADALCGTPIVAVGKLWVSGCDVGDGAMNGFSYEVDPKTNAVIGQVPGGLGVFGDGSLWTEEGKDLYRIDPRSRVLLAKIHVPGANPLSVSQWVVAGIANGSVWATTDSTVVRVSTATNAVSKIVQLPGVQNAVFATGWTGPSELAISHGRIWLTQYPGLYRIDPAANTAQLTGITVGPFDQWGDGTVIASSGSLWVRTTDKQVVRLDPATTTVSHRYPAAGGGGGFTVAFGSLWVVNAGSDTVWRESLG